MLTRMVILRFSALGDIAMTVPAIYSLAAAYPDMEIYVATRPFFARMFINAPTNVRIVSFDLKGEYNGVGGTLRIARELASLHPAYVADLHNMLRTAFITGYLRLHGAKTATVDKGRISRKKVYHGGEPQEQYIERYFDTFRKLGFDVPCTFKSVFTSPVATPIDIKHPAIGIAPFARYKTKTYPPEKMRRVARMLVDRGYNVYLFGGRGTEAEMLASWQQDGIVSLAGQFQLEDELAIMSNLDVMVSMDSANQHLAALAGTRVVSVWGSTTPACGFLGFGQTYDNVVCLNLPCQPCNIAGSDKCPLNHMDCLNKLSEESIVNKVISICNN